MLIAPPRAGASSEKDPLSYGRQAVALLNCMRVLRTRTVYIQEDTKYPQTGPGLLGIFAAFREI